MARLLLAGALILCVAPGARAQATAGLERLGHASNGYNLAPLEWFDYLNDRRIDYDVIGLQYRAGRMCIGQVGSQDNPIVDLHLISSYLDAYGTLGKRVHITEFVISDNAGVRGPWKWGQQEQVDYATGFYTIAFSKPFVDAVVWWNAERFAGFWDGKRPGPVFLALGDLISTEWTTHGSRTTDSAGQVRFTGCAGDYELTISRGDLQKNENIHLDAATVSPHTVVLREATN